MSYKTLTADLKTQWKRELGRGPGPAWPLFLETGLVYLLSCAFFYYYQFLSPYLPSTDPFYHIKFAYLLRTEGFIHNFRWATLSLWADHFCDKEFLYHVYLMPFTLFSNLETGAKVATVILAAAGTASFYAILRLNKAVCPWLWYFLLMTSGGFFLYRINMTRPQALSILLSLWSLHFIINRQYIKLALISFIYTWSYTAFHLPLMYALLICVHELVLEKRLDLRAPLAAFSAMLAGMLTHPYFPENFRMFYLQNFYILYQSSYSAVDLHMGGEFSPMTTRKLLEVITSVVIPYFAAFFCAMAVPKKIDAKTRGVFIVSLAMILLSLMVKRFVEYSVPFTLMFCAMFFSHYKDDFSLKTFLRERPRAAYPAAALVLVVLAVLAVRSHRDVKPQYEMEESIYKQAALYLQQNTKKDEVVFTCDWDDAPDLFFYNHSNRYLVFLDPNFMYAWKPEIWKEWDDAANGRLGDATYDALKNDFKTNWGVCTSDFTGIRTLIRNDKRFSVPYEDQNTFVFRLNDPDAPPKRRP